MSTSAFTTIRLKTTTRELLRELAAAAGTSMQAVIDEAVEDLRRKRFLDQVNRDYAALRSDADAWEGERSERRRWEATLADGLDRGERWAVRETASTRRGSRRRKR